MDEPNMFNRLKIDELKIEGKGRSKTKEKTDLLGNFYRYGIVSKDHDLERAVNKLEDKKKLYDKKIELDYTAKDRIYEKTENGNIIYEDKNKIHYILVHVSHIIRNINIREKDGEEEKIKILKYIFEHLLKFFDEGKNKHDQYGYNYLVKIKYINSDKLNKTTLGKEKIDNFIRKLLIGQDDLTNEINIIAKTDNIIKKLSIKNIINDLEKRGTIEKVNIDDMTVNEVSYNECYNNGDMCDDFGKFNIFNQIMVSDIENVDFKDYYISYNNEKILTPVHKKMENGKGKPYAVIYLQNKQFFEDKYKKFYDENDHMKPQTLKTMRNLY